MLRKNFGEMLGKVGPMFNIFLIRLRYLFRQNMGFTFFQVVYELFFGTFDRYLVTSFRVSYDR